jgi:hypothetical protein
MCEKRDQDDPEDNDQTLAALGFCADHSDTLKPFDKPLQVIGNPGLSRIIAELASLQDGLCDFANLFRRDSGNHARLQGRPWTD